MLGNSKPLKEVFKEYGKKLDEQWNEWKVYLNFLSFESALHRAAKEDNARIIGILLDSLTSGEHSKALKKCC
jgi:hypothetical protein